jgi:hypothetical protein
MKKIILVLSFFAISAQAQNKWTDQAEHIHNAFKGKTTLSDAISHITMPSDDPEDQPTPDVLAVVEKIQSTCVQTIKETPKGGTATFNGANCAAHTTATLAIQTMTEKLVKAQMTIKSDIKDAELAAFLTVGATVDTTNITQTQNNGVYTSNITQKGTITSLTLGKVPYVVVLKAFENENDDTKNNLNVNQTFTLGKAKGNVWVNMANEKLTCAIDGQKAADMDCLAALYLMGADFESFKKLAVSLKH